MSLSDLRLTLLSLPLLAVGACGFEPIYAPGGPAEMLQGKVLVQEPSGIIDFRMVQEIEAQLGQTTTPTYELGYTLSVERERQAITANNSTLRYTLSGTLDYRLTDIDSADVTASGTVEDFVGYSAAGSSLETLASERDAEQRLAVALANDLTTRLYGTVGELP